MAAVQDEHGQLRRLFVPDARSLDLGHVGKQFRVVFRRRDERLERHAAAVQGGVQERVENGLPVRAAAGCGHDRGDDVDQLREAGDLDAVGMVEQRDQHAADQQRVLDVVDVLEPGGRLDPGLEFLVGAVGVVPHVPLVERQVHLLFGAEFRLDVVAGRHDARDERVHFHRPGQEAVRVVVPVSIVLVQADVVRLVVGVRQDLRFPTREGGHLLAGAAAGDQLDRRVDQVHQLGGLDGDAAVLGRGLGTHLPGAVHLVAQAPEFDAVRVLVAVGDAHVAVVRAGRVVAVLDQRAGLVRAAGTQVDRHDRRGFSLFAPRGELVRSERIVFERVPGQIQPPGPVFLGADAVFPVVARNEVAAGIPDGGDRKLLHHRDDVLAEALRVRLRVAGLVDAAVHRAAQVLDERSEDALVHLGDLVLFVDPDG